MPLEEAHRVQTGVAEWCLCLGFCPNFRKLVEVTDTGEAALRALSFPVALGPRRFRVLLARVSKGGVRDSCFLHRLGDLARLFLDRKKWMSEFSV